MKYLKKFNESRDELKEFCDSHLSYLIDKGFNVSVSEIYGDEGLYVICIDRGYSLFSYKSIVDELLPFLEFLESNYKLWPFDSFEVYGDEPYNIKIGNCAYNINDILDNDILLDDDMIYDITISPYNI